MGSGQFYFFLTATLALGVTTALAYIKYAERKRKEFKHLGEFFASMLLLVLVSYRFGSLKTPVVVLSFLPWMWNLRTLGLLCEDICGQVILRRGHSTAVGVGSVLSIALASIGYQLPIILIPYSFSVILVGLSMLVSVFQKGFHSSFGPLHYWNFLLIIGFLGSRLAFLQDMGPAFDFLFAILFCVSLFPLYSEFIFEKQEKFLENALYVRNKQLFSHSSFSEFKILSAGITHEINNALTIINAKIEQLIRQAGPNQEKGLRLILHSADRIGRSIRGLREFIYPQDQLEELKIEDLVKHVLMLYGQRLKNHDVSVTTHGLSGKYIRCHRIQLEQVFLSLLSNSVDNIDKLDDKWIDISCRAENEKFIFTFKDSSRGIAPDVESMLTDPFFCTEENIDNGIRLILAKDIIVKHGGTFQYQSDTPNTTFVFSIPQADSIHRADEYTEHLLH